MAVSLVWMALYTYGLYTEIQWFQWGSIILFVIITLVYGMWKNARAMPSIRANMEGAERAMRGRILFEAKTAEVDESRVRARDMGDAKMGANMALTIAPLIIFLGAGYVIGLVMPGIKPWMTFLISFLLTIPFSLALSLRGGTRGLGVSSSITPRSYSVTERGIVLRQMGGLYLLPFPVKSLKVDEEKGIVEVECQPTKIPTVPSKARLFARDVERLTDILSRFLKEKEEVREGRR